MHHSKASFWHQQRSLSRRDCIGALAAAAVVPAFMRSTPAWAAEDPKFDAAKLSWRVLSRDDLGFSVEFPREPEISDGVNVDEFPGYSFKYTSAEVRFDDVTFNVAVREPARGGPVTAADGPKLLDTIGAAIQTGKEPGMQSSITRFTMNGCPGARIPFASTTSRSLTARSCAAGASSRPPSCGFPGTIRARQLSASCAHSSCFQASDELSAHIRGRSMSM